MTCTENMQHLLTSSQIQSLILVVLAGPLLASSPDPPQRDTSFTRLPLNDVLFTEDVLMEVSARSRIECSKKCMETEGCVMCTFHSSPQGPPGHCRLHSQLKTASDGKQSMLGAKSVALRLKCDADFDLVWGRCVKAVKRSVQYATARQDCRNMQGELVVAKTATEIKSLWSYANKKGLARVWVGGDDLEVAGVFRWKDGTLLPDDSPLWTGDELEPDHKRRGGDCVYLYYSNPGLYDRPCSLNQQQYMCQKDGL